MSIRGVLVRGAALAMLVTLLPPVGTVEVSATPVTLSERIEGLPAASAAASGLEAAEEASGRVRSESVEAPLTFSALGFSAPRQATELRVRTSTDGEQWTPWEEVEFLDELEGPDNGGGEAGNQPAGRHSDPLWVEEATHLQIEVAGADTGDVDVTVIDSMGLSGGPVHRTVDTKLGQPAEAADIDLISRAEWGADESLGSDTSVADEVHMGVVHHTAHASGASANSYSEAEAPGIVRAMHQYHTRSLGWSDLGYNVVVDRFGNIYEGRKGGFTQGVIGAHTRGFNTGSFGVSVIGNFNGARPSSAAVAAVTKVIGVKSGIHGIDPTGFTTQMPGDTARPTVIGHRDAGQTNCPGLLYDHLAQIREDARELAVRFPDVPSSSPHREAILRLADAGVTYGCRPNEYCPDRGLNRAQASSFVVRALELSPLPGSLFPDVGADGAHAPTINVLVDRGWLIGYPDGLFRPWEPMTRGQLATLLARSLGLPLDEPASDPYPDVSRDATHAPGIAALRDVGIRGDCGGGRYCADDMALRDSTASFVDMVRDYLGGPVPAGQENDGSGTDDADLDGS